MEQPLYQSIIAFCESFFQNYGDTDQGVGWPRGDAALRYRVMLDLLRPSPSPATLLDFGCGTSRLYEHILAEGPPGITYSGLDLSDLFLEASRRKFPLVAYYRADLLELGPGSLPGFDYVVMNGIFTYKGRLPHNQMFDYLCRLVARVFDLASVGIAFNVMSKQVDWERDDLFHVPVDALLSFLSRNISRHIVVRHDYGLYEYTVYVYRQAYADKGGEAKRLLERASSPWVPS